jgi:hypothetical protein
VDKDLKKIDPAFRPVGRLFLSADLVGSTAHKQNPTFPIPEDGSSWPEHELSPPWLSPISDFFSHFSHVFKSTWDDFCASAQSKKLPSGKSPELWKANGDELIFVKELNDRRELYGCLLAWIAAIKKYREILQKAGGLDIKSTAWFAGFPVTNSEVIFWRDLSDDDKVFQGDPRLNQIHLREIWHKSLKNRNKLLRDFIGPTIDTGFRLTAISSARKMVISLDVAYLAATSKMPHAGTTKGTAFEWFNIVYDGRQPLKGVMNGIPYPVFWIDVGKDNSFNAAEDNISSKPNYLERDPVIEFCNQFYSEYKKFLLVPFFVGEEDSQYGELPENYKKFLIARQDRWRAERTRYETETATADQVDARGEDVPKSKIRELGKSAKARKS